jgi:hypothetical protein
MGTRDAAGTPGVAGVHAVVSSDQGTFAYDARGNQVSAPGRESVTYTSFDLPKSVTRAQATTTFEYDASQTRVVKRGPSASTVYVGSLYEKRTNSAGITHVFRVPAGGRIVAQVEWHQLTAHGALDASKVTYLHDDHLGSTESTSSAADATATHFTYEPFGQLIDPRTAIPTST